MKKVLTLNHSEMTKFIRNIVESLDGELDRYTELDLYDAFIQIFRNWLKNKIGDEQLKLPFSYLLKKYSKDFLREVLGDYGEKYLDRHYSEGVSPYLIRQLVSDLVSKGVHKLPSLRTDIKITERFKKVIDKFISKLNLPPHVKIELNEERPGEIDGEILVDFQTFLMDKDNPVNANELNNRFRKFFQDSLGIDLDNPTHGGLEFNMNRVFVGEDDWIKNVLNKKIKKEIKKIPFGDSLASVKFSVHTNSANLELRFKSSSDWGPRRGFRDKVKEYLQSLGYNNVSVST